MPFSVTKSYRSTRFRPSQVSLDNKFSLSPHVGRRRKPDDSFPQEIVSRARGPAQHADLHYFHSLMVSPITPLDGNRKATVQNSSRHLSESGMIVPHACACASGTARVSNLIRRSDRMATIRLTDGGKEFSLPYSLLKSLAENLPDEPHAAEFGNALLDLNIPSITEQLVDKEFLTVE